MVHCYDCEYNIISLTESARRSVINFPKEVDVIYANVAGKARLRIPLSKIIKYYCMIYDIGV